jgi:hypothetical protein
MITPAQPESQPSTEDEEARFQRLYETVWRQRLLDSLNDPSIVAPPSSKPYRSLLLFGLFDGGLAVSVQLAIWLTGQLKDYAWLPVFWLVVLTGVAITSPLAIRAVRGFRQYFSVGARQALRADRRRPVLYLRSFALDATLMSRLSLASRIFGLAVSSMTLEERVVKLLGKLGPVIAIGRPGEQLPTLGAARFYVSNERWNQKVAEIVSVAQLVVWASGTSSGLRWELSHLLKMLDPGRLLLWLHPNILGLYGEAREREWEKFREQFADLLPPQFPATIGETRFIYLAADGTPVAVPPDDYVRKYPDSDALRNLLYSTGKLKAPRGYWRASSRTAALGYGFAAGILAWLTTGIWFFVGGLLWPNPKFPAGLFLERVFSQSLSLLWVFCSFVCGGVWGIALVTVQPYLAHRRISYPSAAILFAVALGWMTYAAMLAATGLPLRLGDDLSYAASLVDTVLWPMLWGVLWGYFIVLLLRLLPAAPGRPKPP